MARILGVICLSLVLQGTPKSAEVIKKEVPPFICIDGAEIALANVCDGRPHCADSSDETTKLCHHVVCPPTSFRCAYGACTARSGRCNGLADCVDGSDEFFCDNDDKCTDRNFRCSTSQECVSFARICDGFADCADGSDENSTICKDYVCPEHTFQCSYGGCVHQEVVCDGVKDCIDGTDEAEDLCAAANCKENCEKYACRADQFACENGHQCIPVTKLCDGTHQCRDASDEKSEICKDRPCPEGTFRCAYGGCVPASARCNLKPNCHDWSDEDEAICGNKIPQGACRLPAAKPGTWYTVAAGCEKCRPGDVVPELTRLDYGCHGNVSIEGASLVHCQGSKWLPAVPVCPDAGTTIKCPAVRAPGATKRCEVKWGPEAGWTTCDQPLAVGTRVTMECREFYERERGSTSVTCLHDGTWNQAPLSCRPVCGMRTSTSTALIVKGWDAPAEEPLPWHATLFSHVDGVWKFFCGGTLIAESIVLTAAHCIWKTAPDTIRVVLATNSSNFTNLSEKSQVRDVSKIEVQEFYQDHEGNYNSDLALLILHKPVEINSHVLPACIDWSNKYDVSRRSGEVGIIAGMGVTENDTFSATLRLVTAPVIAESLCREREARDFRKYLQYTTFCAGWANGTAVCNGDSGGGFLMRRPQADVWDIHGIVSLSPRRITVPLCDPSYYTVFTRVSAYVDWIKKIVQSIPVSEAQAANNDSLPNNDNVILD